MPRRKEGVTEFSSNSLKVNSGSIYGLRGSSVLSLRSFSYETCCTEIRKYICGVKNLYSVGFASYQSLSPTNLSLEIQSSSLFQCLLCCSGFLTWNPYGIKRDCKIFYLNVPFLEAICLLATSTTTIPHVDLLNIPT